MTETPDDRPRPTPRSRPTPAPRATSAGRPSPRPRVAGSRREREEAAALAVPDTTDAPADTTGKGASSTGAPGATVATGTGRRSRPRRSSRGEGGTTRRRFPALLALLAVLCLIAAAVVGFLSWQRLNPRYVDQTVFAASRSAVEDLFAYDYRDSKGSIQRKLEVLTGDLRTTYETELNQGGIIDTYEQVSATTSFDVRDVGLQQINEAQDSATVVVFGRYVAKSVTSGNGAAPEGSECQVTDQGEQSCVQTFQLRMVQVDGDWKITEYTQL